MPSLRAPDHRSRPHRRLVDAGSSKLASTNHIGTGAAYANTDIRYALIPVAGSVTCRVRAKVTGANATLDFIFVGPDFPVEQTVAFANLVGTQYTTGNATQLALTADTEAMKDVTVVGEGYLLLKLTGSGTGSIVYVDVSQLSYLR